MPEVQNGETKVDVNKTRNQKWIEKTFSASALLSWIKGSISVDYRFVRIVEPNTILGIIPAGQQTQNIPLKNITSSTISTSYSAGRFLLGGFLALAGLFMLGSNPLMGLILAVVGVGIFLNGMLTQLSIEKAGSAYIISVPFFNKEDVIAVSKVINEALATDIDKTDQSLYQHRLADDNLDNVR